MAAHDNWPSGVIGLVASRLVESYGRPAFLFHLTKDGKAKGSCRSIEAFNIFDKYGMKVSVNNMMGLRPKRSDSGPRMSWPNAFPSITMEIEAITRLGVVPSPSAILGTPAKNISMPIGPNMFNKPNIIVRNKSALPPGIDFSWVIFSAISSYKKAGGAWPPTPY